jgi:acetyl/propionyl-CoA carboxylase alpha subunit
VIEAGLVWIGPPPSAISAMGLKDAAKALMQQAGVPTTPGYLGEDQDPARLAQEAAIGYPVLIKAVAGAAARACAWSSTRRTLPMRSPLASARPPHRSATPMC